MGDLTGVYIYGSVGRGEQDDQSDLDLLAIVQNGTGKVEEQYVLELVPKEFRNLKHSISWYGQNRITEMYENGELFAWHLHSDTIPLFEKNPFLNSLGKPNAYQEGVKDVASFQKVLCGIPSQLNANRNNAIYEAGLIYVCLRNIAMSASWSLCRKPDFSRYSPFKLDNISHCPISKDEYEMTLNCRMASQRGLPPPHVNIQNLTDIYFRLEPWVEEIRAKLEGSINEQKN